MIARPLRILVVSRMFPFPPNRGERKRVYYLLRELSRHHRVTLISRLHTEEDVDSLKDAEEVCERVLSAYIPSPRNPVHGAVRVMKPLFSNKPLRLGALCFPQIGRLIYKELSERDYDVVQFHHTPLTYYLDYIPKSYQGVKVINLHNLETRLLERMAASPAPFTRRFMLKIDARRMKRYEPVALSHFDHIFTVSDVERDQVLVWLPGKPVTTIENGVDTEEVLDHDVLSAENCAPELVFVGSMKYLPNENAVYWFVREVLPIVREYVPDVHLTVVGHDPSPRLRALSSKWVQITGAVASVWPYYRRAAVAVVPLREGGGTRHKILEAMNFGVPVVSTSLGAEGLDVRSGVDLEIEDEAQAFARKVIYLLQHPEARTRLASNARARVRERYDWRAIGRRLEQALYETVERFHISRSSV